MSEVIDTGVYAFSSLDLFNVLSTLVEGKPPPNMERAESLNTISVKTRRGPQHAAAATLPASLHTRRRRLRPRSAHRCAS